jgi:PIN domain nuclease of toxin-antitoxin system
MLLLDTCVLLWLASDTSKLSSIATREIAKNAQGLFVSAISALEIAIKSRNGKLALPLPPQIWFLEALAFHGIHELPVTSAIATASVHLPLLHNDPCDRIIIATSALSGMKIVTCDSLIANYEQADTIW